MDPSVCALRLYTFVEPPLFLNLFSRILSATVITDLMVFLTCQSIHSDNKTLCNILHTHSQSPEALNLEAEAQPYASYILMCQALVEGIVPALLSFFLGPWSDKYGRKPLLLAGYSGSSISFLLWLILCTQRVNSWTYLLCSVPTALLGGLSGVILASFCYITDIRKEEDRAWHLTWLQAMIAAAVFAGTFAGSTIFKLFGYTAVFGVACGFSTLATLYVFFFVPETVVRTDTDTSCCKLFDISLVTEMFEVCLKKRHGFNRVVVWSCITCLALNVLAVQGDFVVLFLFVSAKFGWDVSDYSSLQASTVVFGIVGTLLGGHLFRTFLDKDMMDMRIAILANVSAFAGAITKSFSTRPWHLYLSSGLAMCSGLSSPVLRAVLSKTGQPQDVGKVFSLSQSVEALLPLTASPLYMTVYTHNMPPIYPASVFLITAGIFATSILLVVFIDRKLLTSRNSQYVSINEEVD